MLLAIGTLAGALACACTDPTTPLANGRPDGVLSAHPIPSVPRDSLVATAPIEALGVVSATQVRDGLGFNVDPSQPWQLQLAKDAGAREVRMQFAWNDVEQTAGQLQLSPTFRAALATSASLGLHPLIVAAYGPRWARAATLTVGAAASVGDTVITLTPASALDQVARGYSYAQRTDGAQIVAEGYWAYPGAYVSSVRRDANQIVLAAPLTVALKSGEQIAISNRLYKPPVPGDAGDASLAAYVRYVQFLANEIARAGATGHVELWNEPGWAHDRWDGGEGCFFASGPEKNGCQSMDYDFARALLNTTAPAGVRYTWGGTHKTGFATLIAGASAGVFHTEVTQAQVASSVSEEAFHPYGPSPEWHAWNPQCVARNGVADFYSTCALIGTNPTSNFKWARKTALDHLARTGWTIDQTVSEAGILTSNAVAKARYLMRFYLAHHALGLKRIDFYRLADGSAAANYGVVDATTRTPALGFQAFQGLMQELDGLTNAPVAYDSTGLPAVTVAETAWPVTTATIVGRAPGAARNTVLLTLWQRTYGATPNDAFDQFPAAAQGRVVVRVPAGYSAVRAWSLVDQRAVEVTTRDGGTIELSVGDDPVAIRFETG